MSGRIKISFVDFLAFSSENDRIRYVSMRSFLERNWCGSAGGLSASISTDGRATDEITESLKVIGSNPILATRQQALENTPFSRAFCCQNSGPKFRSWKRRGSGRRKVAA
jgi:hypothetical protein